LQLELFEQPAGFTEFFSALLDRPTRRAEKLKLYFKVLLERYPVRRSAWVLAPDVLKI
jgi:hypothetical protein